VTWETEAQNWIAWTRAPRHDAYWYYRDWFFEWMVPPPGRATLDLGCGEGRVARDLRDRGHSVTGVDSAPTLVRAAEKADPEGTYLVADAATLPLDDGSFDLVVAYNSLMDIEDMPGAVREAARVLEPGGRLCVCVTHPILDAGTFESREPDAPFRLTENYRERRRFEGTFERAGLQITFRGWCHPLEAYLRAFEGAGLLLERLREPGDPAEDPRHARVPLFLYLRAVKPA
jgi:ubiquinone/menaquinone biosynthesis C-methylase UbiE